jgi:microcystin-dependent protein
VETNLPVPSDVTIGLPTGGLANIVGSGQPDLFGVNNNMLPTASPAINHNPYPTGTSAPFNNMQPTLIVNKIIKVL